MIRVLPIEVANKIAAGEVVERPSSILKELMENSLDANAKNIVVSIDGVNIRIDDDGVGMSRDDMILSVKRFATSKINTEKDLFAIATFGFRGEALPSIISIAKVTMISRSVSDDIGTKIEFEGGKMLQIEDASRSVGTTVDVKNIFYNTPARLKFLKGIDTEYRYLLEVFEQVVLINNDVRFKLIRNGKVIYDLFPSSVKDRFLSILPKGAIDLVEINGASEHIKLSGFVSSPKFARSSKDLEFIYVNKRIIFNNIVQKAIMEGYGLLLDKGKYPIYLISLEIPNNEVDVNAHPRKMEVRFRNSNEVFNLVKYSINKVVSLNRLGDILPKKDLQNRTFVNEGDHDIKITKNVNRDFKFDIGGRPRKTSRMNNSPLVSNFLSDLNISPVSDIVVYQLFNKFLVTEKDDVLQIIDQHAASECVNYEKIKEQFVNKSVESQHFLLPYSINISKKNMVIIENNLSLFSSLGINIEVFGEDMINVISVPIILKDSNVEDMIDDLINKFSSSSSSSSTEDKINIILATIACHASVRFGDEMNMFSAKQLISDLRKCKNPFTCPHGRPTTFEIPVKELYKNFKRL